MLTPSSFNRRDAYTTDPDVHWHALTYHGCRSEVVCQIIVGESVHVDDLSDIHVKCVVRDTAISKHVAHLVTYATDAATAKESA